MTDAITPVSYYPATPAEEEQSAAVRDPILDPDGAEDGTGELTFADVLDVLNPLQHIPVVSSVYRALTGDEIAQGPQLAGDLIYGGPVGLIGAGARALFEEASGVTMDGAVASLLGTDEKPEPAAVAAIEPDTKAVVAESPAKPADSGPEPSGNAAALAALARDLRGLSQNLVKERLASSDKMTDHRAVPDTAPAATYANPPMEHATGVAEQAVKPRHPNLPPVDASPAWIAQAMERGLVKYRNAARTGGPSATPAAAR